MFMLSGSCTVTSQLLSFIPSSSHCSPSSWFTSSYGHHLISPHLHSHNLSLSLSPFLSTIYFTNPLLYMFFLVPFWTSLIVDLDGTYSVAYLGEGPLRLPPPFQPTLIFMMVFLAVSLIFFF